MSACVSRGGCRVGSMGHNSKSAATFPYGNNETTQSRFIYIGHCVFRRLVRFLLGRKVCMMATRFTVDVYVWKFRISIQIRRLNDESIGQCMIVDQTLMFILFNGYLGNEKYVHSFRYHKVVIVMWIVLSTLRLYTFKNTSDLLLY